MSFTLFLGSFNGATDIVPNNNNWLSYYFDFSLTPEYDGAYEITYSYQTRNMTQSGIQIAHPQLLFGDVAPDNYLCNATTVRTGRATTTLYGVLNSANTGSVNQTYATDPMNNVPTFLPRKPQNNFFQLRLRGFQGAGTVASGLLTDRMMVIHFRAISEPIPPPMPNHSFTLFLNSYDGNAVGSPAILNAVTEFNVNWEALSRHTGKFRLTSQFTTGSIATTLDDVDRIDVDWGCQHDAYMPNLTGRPPQCQTIAVFRPNPLPTSGRYAYDRDQCLPIILQTLPTKNQFTVKMLDMTGASETAFVVDWNLTLFFEAI